MGYVDWNRFFETYRGPADDFFGTVGSKPEIYPIYWSHAQMEARQSVRMARVQRSSTGSGSVESDGVQWFAPTETRSTPIASAGDPRAPSSGLGAHLDPGTLDCG